MKNLTCLRIGILPRPCFPKILFPVGIRTETFEMLKDLVIIGEI